MWRYPASTYSIALVPFPLVVDLVRGLGNGLACLLDKPSAEFSPYTDVCWLRALISVDLTDSLIFSLIGQNDRLCRSSALGGRWELNRGGRTLVHAEDCTGRRMRVC